MPLVNAKCSNCGGILEIDNNNEAFVCKYCGMPCITEKAINNYNIVNNNDIHDSVVYIYNVQNEGTDIDYFERAKEYLKIGNNEQASKMYSEARRLNPTDGEVGFWGMMQYGMRQTIGFSGMNIRDYVKQYPKIQEWERSFFEYELSLAEKENYARMYFSCFFSGRYFNKNENIRSTNEVVLDKDRCRFIVDICSASVDFPKKIEDFRYSIFYDAIYSPEKFEFLLQLDKKKIFKPYNVSLEYGSIYEMYLAEGRPIARLEILPNQQIASLIEQYYPINEEITKCKSRREELKVIIKNYNKSGIKNHIDNYERVVRGQEARREKALNQARKNKWYEKKYEQINQFYRESLKRLDDMKIKQREYIEACDELNKINHELEVFNIV